MPRTTDRRPDRRPRVAEERSRFALGRTRDAVDRINGKLASDLKTFTWTPTSANGPTRTSEVFSSSW
ncbi:hypothetical protein A6E15_00770 [Natrinema saccharevitans]|uniref:Uncharacterized protein n=1 Tax=Natrinema saccharevitans TaxID=301967 RepID=A0A1S8AT03_9EURY|nr:hypothetical protein A6E15_00770 [Natrinema saccharevitans]